MKSRVFFAAPVVVALALAFSCLPVAAKDEFHYDAAACKTDAKGHLYIALGRNVLAVSFLKNGTYFLAPVPLKARRLAPDPTEREGCPGNPSQQGSFAFEFGTPLLDSDGRRNEPVHREAPTRLSLFNLEYLNRNADGDQLTWSGESAGLLELTCAQATIRETLPNGLKACRIKPVYDARVENWGASYIAGPNIYATPLGRPFIVDCGPGLQDDMISHCRIAYVFAPGLAVGYDFQPYLGSSPLPIDHIIDFDRRLRAQINAALVKDFIWPKQENDNSGKTGDKP
jgi:hypothetical protein